MEDPTKPNFTHHPYFICSICECPREMHTYFFTCPLLEGEKICCECCHSEVALESIIKKFKDIGLEYNREGIDAKCQECGKRSVGEGL